MKKAGLFYPAFAINTLKQFLERARRLYEQEPGKIADSSWLGMNIKRLLAQMHAGLFVRLDRS